MGCYYYVDKHLEFYLYFPTAEAVGCILKQWLHCEAVGYIVNSGAIVYSLELLTESAGYD
jgi:hypothetical protein